MTFKRDTCFVMSIVCEYKNILKIQIVFESLEFNPVEKYLLKYVNQYN